MSNAIHNEFTANNIALVIGANGGISQAIIKQLIHDTSIDKIIAISRSVNTNHNDKVEWILSDNHQPSIQECGDYLMRWKGKISQVFITNGILQTDSIRPERALKELSVDSMHDVFHANTVVPSLWLAKLGPLLSLQDKTKTCVVSVLSARVGSITDNQLGGWHSYRASKAALNMILKGAAIEFVRNRINVRLIAFHPGTTDTKLSKPFQASVPKDKLFTPEFVANKLIGIMSDIACDSKASAVSFLDWNNQDIDW